MTFVKYYCMGSVQFINRREFNILEDSIDEELEVLESSVATMKIMCSSDRTDVRDNWSDLLL